MTIKFSISSFLLLFTHCSSWSLFWFPDVLMSSWVQGVVDYWLAHERCWHLLRASSWLYPLILTSRCLRNCYMSLSYLFSSAFFSFLRSFLILFFSLLSFSSYSVSNVTLRLAGTAPISSGNETRNWLFCFFKDSFLLLNRLDGLSPLVELLLFEILSKSVTILPNLSFSWI